MIRRAALLVLLVASTYALAKLPPPSDEAKAKAAEAAAKAAWTDKVAAYQLCKSMDKVASAYYADAKKAGRETKPPVSTPPCTDPGPFAAATPASGKPLEGSGAHSPPRPPTTPPSTKAPSAEQSGAKK